MVPIAAAFRLARFARLSIICGILLGGSLAPRELAADVGGWKSLGPRVPGGYAEAIAVDPISGAVLAGGRSGVSRSTDGGATWSDASAGVTFGDVHSLAIDPRTHTTVYAATSGNGVFKSVDAGSSWTRLASSPVGADVIAIAPLTPSTLYAGGAGAGVSKSTDGGVTWSFLANLPLAGARAIAVDPAASGTVWVGGDWDYATDASLARTTDGGVSWSPVAIGPGQSTVLTIAIESSPAVILIGQYGGDSAPILRSTSGGATWFGSSAGLPAAGIAPLSLAFDRQAPLTVYLGWNGGFFRSVDGGFDWEAGGPGLGLPFGSGGPSAVAALAADPRSLGVVYAVTSDEGAIFRSANGGATWDRRPAIFQDVGIGALAVDPTDPRIVYAARNSGDPGLFRTTDGGASWSFRSIGTPFTYITGLVVDPAAPATIYVATYGGGVWKSTDRGATFVPSNTGLVLFVDSLAIVPGGGSVLFASTDSGLFRTPDGGATWSPTGQSDGGFYRLAVAGASPPILYGGGIGMVLQSVDGGATFHPVSAGLTGIITSIVVDPTNSSTVYVSGRTPYYPQPLFFPPTNNGVARTTDGGATWEIRNSGLAITDVNALALDPRDPTHLFAATDLGVFASNSSGIGWFSIDDGLTSRYYGPAIPALAVDAATPPNLYAGTATSGVFRRGAAISPAPCAADATTVCLQGGRFQTRVTWSTPESGGGDGHAVSLTADTGAFWFFTASNLELVVKVVDGRPFNGRFWVFAGALSDVEYEIEVTDTSTGAVRRYRHVGGTSPESVGDAAAF